MSYIKIDLLEYNAETIVEHWILTNGVILSIMHNTNNDNLYTLKTFYIFFKHSI
jgi:hypothetical protein